MPFFEIDFCAFLRVLLFLILCVSNFGGWIYMYNKLFVLCVIFIFSNLICVSLFIFCKIEYQLHNKIVIFVIKNMFCHKLRYIILEEYKFRTSS